MARREVLEVTCDRCKKTDLQSKDQVKEELELVSIDPSGDVAALNDGQGPEFYIVNTKGEYAGVAMYASERSKYSVCTENGAEHHPLEPLLEGSST